MDKDLKEEISRLINKYDGEKLWREAVKIAIKTNPRIAQETLATIRDIKQERQALVDPTFGVSKGKTMRAGIRMPVSLDNILIAVDPNNFPVNQLELNEQQKVMKKLFKTFPEFTLATKY